VRRPGARPCLAPLPRLRLRAARSLSCKGRASAQAAGIGA
jgi:hypothetical protein